MKIGIDLDGVVYDFERGFRNYLSKKGIDIRDHSKYLLEERYNFKDEAQTRMHLEEFSKNRPFTWIPEMPGATEKLSELEKKHKLFYVTSRDRKNKGMEDTIKRLDDDNLLGEGNLIFEKNKGNLAKELGLHMFIEDCMINIYDIMRKSGAVPVVYEHEYNKKDRPLSVIPMRGWSEIDEIIKFVRGTRL